MNWLLRRLPRREFLLEGRPYMTRYFLFSLFGRRVYLHNIHMEDLDRRLHAHPWQSSYSIVLRGSYLEERAIAFDAKAVWVVERPRTVRWFNRLRGVDFHRIARIDGPLWTLFIAGERVVSSDGWAFLDEDGLHIHMVPFSDVEDPSAGTTERRYNWPPGDHGSSN